MRALETDHRHITFIQPIQISHSTTQVHLEIEIGAVPYVVGHAHLEPSLSGRCIGVSCGVHVTVNALNHHRNETSIAWIIPELRNGRNPIVFVDDVFKAGDSSRSQGDVTTRSLTKHGDFIRSNSIGIAVLSNRLTEVTNCRPAVLNTTVGRLNQLRCALNLGRSGWIVTKAVIHTGNNVSFSCKLLAHGHRARIRTGSQCGLVDVLGEEISCVEIDNQRTLCLRIASRLINVTQQVLRSGKSTLKDGHDRNVFAVYNAFRNLDIGKNLVHISHTVIVDLVRGHKTKRQSHSGCVVIQNLINPTHGLCLSHGGVQRELGRKDGRSSHFVISANGSFTPPLPRSTVIRF